MRSDAQLVIAAAYIATNPVAAGLCARAGDFGWSSYAATLADAAPSGSRPNG